jgi:signal transduction histidine kinase
METTSATRTNQHMLEALFQTINDGVIELAPDGRIVRLNPAAQRLFGELNIPDYAKLSLAARAQREQLHTVQGIPVPPDQSPPVRLLRGEQLMGDHAVELLLSAAVEKAFRIRFTGTPLYDDAGHLTGAVEVLHDVTAEANLRSQVQHLLTTLETVQDGVILFDLSGQLILLNATMRRLLGREQAPPDAPELHLIDLARSLNVRDARGVPLAREQWPLSSALRGEKHAGAEAMDVWISPVAGDDRYCNITSVPVRDDQGAIVGGFSLVRDNTERWQAQQERLQMLGVVAHELKAPLSTLKLRAELTERHLTERQVELPELAGIHLDLASMLRMVNDLVDASREQPQQIQLDLADYSLGGLCQDVIHTLRMSTGRHITLDFAANPVWVRCDAIRTMQVLTNVLSNALKYSPSNTAVRVAVSQTKGVGKVRISDQGPGIPPEALPHLFERFYRVPGIAVQHGSGVGLGLGLYICKHLLAAQGGTIGVASKPGKGTVFWVTLPLADTVGPAHNAGASGTSGTSGATRTDTTDTTDATRS